MRVDACLAGRYAGHRDRRDPPRRHREDGESSRARAEPVHDGSHRPGDARAGREAAGRLLRLDGAAAAAGRLPGARGPPAHRQAARPQLRSAPSRRPSATAISGVNPSNDGVVIRLNFPPLTEQRRKEYVKIVKNMAEDGRIAVRNIRRDARKHLEAAEKAGSDLGRRARAGGEGAREASPTSTWS